MIRAIINWFRPPPLKSYAALEKAIEYDAARLTQRSTSSYCRVKAGYNADKLFAEPVFMEGLEACRWAAYSAVLSDLVMVAEAWLRPRVGARAPAVVRALGESYERILLRQPRQGNGPEMWRDQVVELQGRLARAQLARPQAAVDFGYNSGPKIYRSLPIHKSLRREDEEVIVNLIRFGLVTLHQELEKRADIAAILADIPDGEVEAAQ